MKSLGPSRLVRITRVDDVNDIPREPTSPRKIFTQLERVSSQPSFSSCGLTIHRLWLLKTRHSFIASNSQSAGQRRHSAQAFIFLGFDYTSRPTLTDGYSLRCGNFTDMHRDGRCYGLSHQSIVAYSVCAMHQVRVLEMKSLFSDDQYFSRPIATVHMVVIGGNV